MEENSDFLAFGNSANNEAKPYRDNFQYRPYNRNRNHNHRNHNFRRDQHFGGRHEGNAQFAPPNFSSPISDSFQPRHGQGFQHRHQHHQNFYQNRRNFNQHKNFGGHNKQRQEAPIEKYFHRSMVEDPWADRSRFNGQVTPEEKLNVQPEDTPDDSDRQQDDPDGSPTEADEDDN